MKNNKLTEGKEELVRALLLMKYDTKKTLSENQENIKHLLKEDVPGVAAGSAVGGAAVGAGLGYAALSSAGAGLSTAVTAGTGLIPIATAIGGAIPGVAAGTGAAFAVGASILGGAAALAVLPLAYWLIRKDTGTASSVKALFQMCSTNASAISKLPRKINDGTIRDLSDKINDAVNYQTLAFMAGTDEESLFGAFNSLKDGTASDACALINKYNQYHGDLYEDLDGDIDSPDEWKKIYRPLRDCIEDSLKGLVAEDPCKDSPGTVWDEKTKSCVPIKSGVVPITNTKWKDCPNLPLTKGCKGEKVSKIQDCLGELVVDGKFGSDTEKALKSKGYDVIITQEIYDKIIDNCGTTTTNTIYTPDRNEMGNNDLNK
jgi:hypothetical protein